ncbi:hypothetical protein Tco_0757521 [Tanacetum coccineum]
MGRDRGRDYAINGRTLHIPSPFVIVIVVMVAVVGSWSGPLVRRLRSRYIPACTTLSNRLTRIESQDGIPLRGRSKSVPLKAPTVFEVLRILMKDMKRTYEGPLMKGDREMRVGAFTMEGPVRARVLNDLSPAEDKNWYKADIPMQPISSSSIPKMQLNSKFVNNMLPEWSRFITEVKLNRGLKESNFDQLYAYLKQHESCGSRFRGRYKQTLRKNHFRETIKEESVVAGNVGGTRNVQRPKRLQESTTSLDKMITSTNCKPREWCSTGQEQSLYLAGRQFINFDEEDQSVQTVHMLCKPKSFYDEKNKVAIGYKNPLCLTRAKQAQSALYNGHVLVTTNHTPTVIHDSEDTREIAEITRKRMLIVKENLLIENENLIANCLSTQLLYDVEKSRCLDLEADMSKVHNESKHISKLEGEYLNLQLKYQHLQESFDNKKSHSFFKIKNLEHQIQEKDNVIRNLKVLVANVNDRSCEPYNAKDVTALIEQNDCVRVELEKVKQHYKELYDSIKITRTHTSEKTSTMLNEIESLKA